VQYYCSQSFYIYILPSPIQHPSFIHLNPGLPRFFPPCGLPSSNVFTVFPRSLLTTCPNHSNMRTLITVTIPWYWNWLQISLFLYSSNDVHMLVYIFSSNISFYAPSILFVRVHDWTT
jgi:hypothetical protein